MKFDKDMKAGIVATEMHIPRRYEYLAHKYPEVSWKQANILWTHAVTTIKTIYKVEYLIDLPFGKGYVEAAYEFEEKLKKANHLAELEKKRHTIMDELEKMR